MKNKSQSKFKAGGIAPIGPETIGSYGKAESPEVVAPLDMMNKILRNMDEKPPSDRQTNIQKDWDEFRETGLIVFINQLLHIFGWCIMFEIDTETKKVVKCYPCRTKWRGFSEADQDKSYQRVTKYMKENVDELIEDVKP